MQVPHQKSPPLEELVIFSSKAKITQSIVFKLTIYFVVSGAILFGSLTLAFRSMSDQFATLALQYSMMGLTEEMASRVYKDSHGNIGIDDEDMEMKWGFDALYSNLAYRLVNADSQEIIFLSVPEGTKGYLLNDTTINVPVGYSRFEDRKISFFREEISLEEQTYYFDITHSDLLADLANEGIEAAITDVAVAMMTTAFILFLPVSFIAIRMVVKPANALTKQIDNINPEDLKQRINVQGVPNELLPITHALNDALARVEISFDQQKRFIADAAHELRTPLTILLNRLELKIPDSLAKHELVNDAQFISRIVEQLLDLSRAQNLKQRHVSAINMAEIIKNVCSHLAPMAIDKGQEFELVDKSQSGLINVDEGELTVVVKNLLENAIRHTPIGATISVSIMQNAFSVSDSGKGISDEFQNLIFERFWRENQSDRNGSGLGLAITKELLSHYQASITVSRDAELGGAKFLVEFPDSVFVHKDQIIS